MKLYKVLNSEMESPFQHFKYELGKKYICKEFDDDVTKDCSRGFYATDIEGLPYSFNIHQKVFLCEVSGRFVEIDIYKRRYESIRLIREVPHEDVAHLARKIDCGYDLEHALFPVNPLKIESGLTARDKELLKKWASVWDSVWDSVWVSVRASVWDSVWDSVRASVGASVGDSVRDSVGDSVGASVGDSVRASVRASVGDSVWDSVITSVWAYISGLFPNIENWKYIEHTGENPFRPAIDLWHRGLVPSFDGKTWRLHAGENAEIVHEWRPE